MATSDFLLTSVIHIYRFSQYSQASVALFSTQFNTDWGAFLSGTVQALATTAAPLVAVLIVSPTQHLYVNPTDWVGFNYGYWQVVPNTNMSGATFTPTTI